MLVGLLVSYANSPDCTDEDGLRETVAFYRDDSNRATACDDARRCGCGRGGARRGDADVCVGMRGGPEEKGAVAVAQGCADATGAGRVGDAQLFLIGRDSTGRR